MTSPGAADAPRLERADGVEARLDELRSLVEAGVDGLELAGESIAGGLGEAVRYAVAAGGKRLRPLLCLATVSALGQTAADALPTALALELVHSFALVHDDLPAIDDDDLRHGRAATHVRFGEDVAILAGDALLNSAYELVLVRQAGSAERRLAVLSEIVLAVGLGGMIGGQFLDVTAPADIAEAGLLQLHRLKTGALIEASVMCGAILSGTGPTVERSLRAFGAEVGLLFQIIDDILDATGTDDRLGKRAGSDERGGKRTTVTILGLDAARALAARSEREAHRLLDAVPGDTSLLRALCDLVARRDR